jgi:hypothetical protein
MPSVLALALLAPGAAWAWSPGEARTVEVYGGVAGAAIDGRAIVVTGAGGTRSYDLSGALRAESTTAGTAVAARDPDGDGLADVVVCGADGVRWLARGTTTFEKPRVISTTACSAVVWTGDRIVAAGAGVTEWTVGDDGPGEPRVLDETAPAFPTIAVQGDWVAVAGVGGQEIREYGPDGRSVIATGGAIAGLAASARGWTWSLAATGELADVTRQKVVVSPSPGRLAAADLDGNGVIDVVVQHEARVGVVLAGEAFERLSAAPSGVLALAAGDGDADGCGDLVFGTGSGFQVVRGLCEGAAVASEEAPPAVKKPTRVTQGHVSPRPPALEEDGTPPEEAEEEPPAEVGSEGGGVVRRTVVLADRPRLEVPAGQRLEATLVAPRGEQRTFAGRGGPEGLVVYGGGRLVFEPEADQVGTWHVSVRMWGGPALVETVDLTIAVLPASATVEPDVEAPAEDDWEEDEEEDDERSSFGTLRMPRAPFAMDLCSLSFGGGGGVTWLPADSWERVGRSAVQPSVSPAAALTCEMGSDKSPLSLFAGIDTAPTFTYTASGTQLGHLGAGTAGFSIGGDAVRFGPYATVGLVLAGVGVRGVVAPFGKDMERSGFEIRASLLASDTTVFEGMLMYTRQMGRFR